jgi:hypothetical protein
MLHALHGVQHCGQPAGHYDEARVPPGGVDATEPDGWHYSTPARWDRDGRRFIWSDRSHGATPHKESDG